MYKGHSKNRIYEERANKTVEQGWRYRGGLEIKNRVATPIEIDRQPNIAKQEFKKCSLVEKGTVVYEIR